MIHKQTFNTLQEFLEFIEKTYEHPSYVLKMVKPETFPCVLLYNSSPTPMPLNERYTFVYVEDFYDEENVRKALSNLIIVEKNEIVNKIVRRVSRCKDKNNENVERLIKESVYDIINQ
jgi:hypothetical protein